MTDEQTRGDAGGPVAEYASDSAPVIFADGVVSVTHGPELVKLYLGRIDASANAVGAVQTKYPAQVVMPLSGFVHSMVFLGEILRRIRDSADSPQNIVAQVEGIIGTAQQEKGFR